MPFTPFDFRRLESGRPTSRFSPAGAARPRNRCLIAWFSLPARVDRAFGNALYSDAIYGFDARPADSLDMGDPQWKRSRVCRTSEPPPRHRFYEGPTAMPRIIEIVLFLTPFLGFAVWRLVFPSPVPPLWLMCGLATAVALMLLTLLWMRHADANKAELGYIPARLIDGRVIPATRAPP